MTTAGWIIMIASVGSVTVLFGWCLYRVLSHQTAPESLHGIDDIETGDDEAGQRRGAILDALDLEADHRQPRGDGGEIGIRREVPAQPGQRELHRRYSPVTSDGWSSAAKP